MTNTVDKVMSFYIYTNNDDKEKWAKANGLSSMSYSPMFSFSKYLNPSNSDMKSWSDKWFKSCGFKPTKSSSSEKTKSSSSSDDGEIEEVEGKAIDADDVQKKVEKGLSAGTIKAAEQQKEKLENAISKLNDQLAKIDSTKDKSKYNEVANKIKVLEDAQKGYEELISGTNEITDKKSAEKIIKEQNEANDALQKLGAEYGDFKSVGQKYFDVKTKMIEEQQGKWAEKYAKSILKGSSTETGHDKKIQALEKASASLPDGELKTKIKNQITAEKTAKGNEISKLQGFMVKNVDDKGKLSSEELKEYKKLLETYRNGVTIKVSDADRAITKEEITKELEAVSGRLECGLQKLTSEDANKVATLFKDAWGCFNDKQLAQDIMGLSDADIIQLCKESNAGYDKSIGQRWLSWCGTKNLAQSLYSGIDYDMSIAALAGRLAGIKKAQGKRLDTKEEKFYKLIHDDKGKLKDVNVVNYDSLETASEEALYDQDEHFVPYYNKVTGADGIDIDKIDLDKAKKPFLKLTGSTSDLNSGVSSSETSGSTPPKKTAESSSTAQSQGVLDIYYTMDDINKKKK